MNKQTQQLIERAYERLDCLNNINMTTNYRDRLYALCEREEQHHRRGRGDGYTTTRALAAQLFIVHDLARLATGEHKMPTLRDTLGLRESFVYAAVLYANYKVEIDAALGTDVWTLAKLDYVRECCK